MRANKFCPLINAACKGKNCALSVKIEGAYLNAANEYYYCSLNSKSLKSPIPTLIDADFAKRPEKSEGVY